MKKNYISYKSNNVKKWLIVIACFCVILFAFYVNITRIQLMVKGYSLSEQNIILALDKKQINDYLQYDQVIHFHEWDQYTNQQHYYDYTYYSQIHNDMTNQEVITYIDSFYKLYNQQLKSLQYDSETCREFMRYFSIDDFAFLAENNYQYSQVKPYLDIKGCIVQDIPKYIQTNQEALSAVLSVSYPFIDSRNEINRTYDIEDPSSYLILIKKGFQVNEDYIPSDLVKVNMPIAPDNENDMLRKEAASALENMYKDAKQQGYSLVLNSGYRSYAEQKAIYEEYFRIYDDVTASGLVAEPGSSEHQLGLGVDLTSQSVIDGERMVFGDTKEYQWVIKNAYQYGFILRYPQNRSDITGTANEPWHLRYVGKEVAKEIKEHQWTLEEYILQYGFSYHLSIQ